MYTIRKDETDMSKKHTFQNITDISSCREVFMILLKTGYELTEFSPVIIKHPIVESGIYFSPTRNEMINFIDEPDKQALVYEEYEQNIKKFNITKLMMNVQNPYKIFFLHLIHEYLSEEDFNHLLRFAYTSSEFPSDETNISKQAVKNLFQIANKQLIMDEDEILSLERLDERVKIYRGYNNMYDGSKECWKGLSWTLSKKTALFYATRYQQSENYLASGWISREKILALWGNSSSSIFSTENECIVDWNDIQELKIERIDSNE